MLAKKSQWYEIGRAIAAGEKPVCEPPPVQDFYLGVIDGVKGKQSPHLYKAMSLLLIEAVKSGRFKVPANMQSWFENLESPDVLADSESSPMPDVVVVRRSRAILPALRELRPRSLRVPFIGIQPIRSDFPDRQNMT